MNNFAALNAALRAPVHHRRHGVEGSGSASRTAVNSKQSAFDTALAATTPSASNTPAAPTAMTIAAPLSMALASPPAASGSTIAGDSSQIVAGWEPGKIYTGPAGAAVGALGNIGPSTASGGGQFMPTAISPDYIWNGISLNQTAGWVHRDTFNSMMDYYTSNPDAARAQVQSEQDNAEYRRVTYGETPPTTKSWAQIALEGLQNSWGSANLNRSTS